MDTATVISSKYPSGINCSFHLSSNCFIILTRPNYQAALLELFIVYSDEVKTFLHRQIQEKAKGGPDPKDHAPEPMRSRKSQSKSVITSHSSGTQELNTSDLEQPLRKVIILDERSAQPSASGVTEPDHEPEPIQPSTSKSHLFDPEPTLYSSGTLEETEPAPSPLLIASATTVTSHPSKSTPYSSRTQEQELNAS